MQLWQATAHERSPVSLPSTISGPAMMYGKIDGGNATRSGIYK